MQVVAHRSGASFSLEHSFEALELSFLQKVDGIEIDILFSKDNVPYVFHDLSLKEITNIYDVFNGKVSKYNFDEYNSEDIDKLICYSRLFKDKKFMASKIIVGITRGTNRNHLCRAALESIALQSTQLLNAMQKDYGSKLSVLKVDGGASQNNLLMQLQADYLGIEVKRPKILELTALGAAFLSGLKSGFYTSKKDLQNIIEVDRVFEPKISQDERDEKNGRWEEAVERSLNWVK